MNWVAYVGNNPLAFIDPTGLERNGLNLDFGHDFAKEAADSFRSGNVVQGIADSVDTVKEIGLDLGLALIAATGVGAVAEASIPALAATGKSLFDQAKGFYARKAETVTTTGLADDVAKTFRFGEYSESTLENPVVLSRYYDNVKAFAKGRFMTDEISKVPFLDRMGMAIRFPWNAMTKVANWEIPAGSTIYKGKAAMQFPWIGGKAQYFVPDLDNIKRVLKK